MTEIAVYLNKWLHPLLFSLLFFNYQVNATQNIPSIDLDLGYQISLDSKSFGQSRDIYIRLPKGYEDSKTNYPVIYLLDTNNEVMTYLDKVYFHSIVTIERLMQRGAIPPSIVVGISIPGEQWYRNVVGKPDELGGFMKNELLPYIKKHYRISGNNITFGQSYTGVFVLNAYAKYPDLFDTFVAVDPILTGPELENALENFRQSTGVKSSRLELIKSDSEFEEFFIFEDKIAALKRTDIHLSLRTVETESHASVYYPALNTELRRHFSDYRTVDLKQALHESYGYKEILEFHTKSAKKYGEKLDKRKVQESIYDVFSGYLSAKRFDEAFELWEHWESNHKAYNVNRRVDNFLRKGDEVAAVAILNRMIEKLPDSPSGYYRLAKIYEKAGKTGTAKAQYKEINVLLSKLNKPEQQRVWNSFGYQLLSENKLEFAIRVFTKVSEAYPDSINALDSLGEAYEAAERYDLAADAFSQAVKLAKKKGSEHIEVFESNLQRVKEKSAG